MNPFKPKRRYKKRLITYKRLFIATVIIFSSYLWYQTCDEVTINDNTTMEVK